MSDDSEYLEVKHSDAECFEVLPDDTAEAIGSTESAVRKIIRENKKNNRCGEIVYTFHKRPTSYCG